MTDKEILKRAIKKAEDRGANLAMIACNRDNEDAYDYWLELAVSSQNLCFSVIFSHDFAKAFFSEEWIKHRYYNYPQEYRAWVIHIQRMALEKEPIKFLEQFL